MKKLTAKMMRNSFARDKNSVVLHEAMLDIRKAFVAALILGVMGIILPQTFNYPQFSVVIPVCCMAAYVWIGSVYSTESPLIEQFADSVYYLGFLFTLTALVISLYFYRSDTLDTVFLVSNFSLALITTIIGLAVRIYITNFQVDLQDVERQMLAGVDQAASEFVRKTKLITMQLEVSHDETQNAINNALENAGKGINQATAQITRHAEIASNTLIDHVANANRAINGVIKEFKQNLDNVQLPEDVFADKLTIPINRFIERLEESQQSVSHITQEQDNIQQYSRQIAGSMEATAQGMDKIGLSLDLFNTKLAKHVQTNDDFGRAVKEITTLAKSTQSISDNLTQQATASLQTIDNLERLVAGIDTLPNLIDNMTTRLQLASENIADVFQTMGNQAATGQRISDELAAIGAALSHTETTIKSLSELGLYATNAYKRLETFNKTIENHTNNLANMGSLARKDIKLAKQHQQELSRILEDSRQSLALINTHFLESVEYVTKRLQD